jgi:hypothetical protein
MRRWLCGLRIVLSAVRMTLANVWLDLIDENLGWPRAPHDPNPKPGVPMTRYTSAGYWLEYGSNMMDGNQ